MAGENTQLDDPQLVYVTCPDHRVAQAIAHALIEHREAACVNIIPGITSVYRWQGAVETDDEMLLLIKTRRAQLDAIDERLARLHPDDVPERIAVSIDNGSPAYMRWLHAQTG